MKLVVTTNDEKSAEVIVPRRLQTSWEGLNFRRYKLMNVTESRFKNRQLHMEDYLQMVSAEQKEYAEVVLLLVTFPRFVYIYPIDIYR